MKCALPGLAPDASQTVTIQTGVTLGALGSISNTATVVGAEPDPVAGNDTDTEATEVLLHMESEVIHGTNLWADLASVGGVSADEDLYRIGQSPYSSYEVVVDGTSGDSGTGQGPELDRLAADGTLLQSALPVGVGASRSLRWENSTAEAVNDESVRVRSGGCTTTCGPWDVYRIRAYETTATIPRFNNSGSQLTVVVLQNPTDYTITGTVYFWSGAGVLLASSDFELAAKQTRVQNASTLAALSGKAGTITIAHDGRYGDLVGKSVTLEAATGFSFDSPMQARPH